MKVDGIIKYAELDENDLLTGVLKEIQVVIEIKKEDFESLPNGPILVIDLEGVSNE